MMLEQAIPMVGPETVIRRLSWPDSEFVFREGNVLVKANARCPRTGWVPAYLHGCPIERFAYARTPWDDAAQDWDCVLAAPYLQAQLARALVAQNASIRHPQTHR